MSVREAFDEWASDGRDVEMEGRHWNTAKHVLARMPVEPGDVLLDLGTGSGYAARALRENRRAGRAYGLDASVEMIRNARTYTSIDGVGYLVGDFGHLPFSDDSIDHGFSMEAFYYGSDPDSTLREVRRVLRPGGTFFCAVNYYEENVYSHDWPERVGVEMTRWNRDQYREAFRSAGFYVAEQDHVADLDLEIPPEAAFPTEDFDTRSAMVERFRELGTLLTVGVVP